MSGTIENGLFLEWQISLEKASITIVEAKPIYL
jgi:hypothetical protein